MRMGKVRWALSLAAIAVLLAVTGTPRAAPAPETGGKSAEAYVAEAVRAFNLGRFAEASGLFEKAYQLDPAPILLFNIGQSERRLGNNERALFFYRRFLAEAPPNAAERKEVEDRVSELERWVREQAALKDRPPPGVERDLSPPPTTPAASARPAASSAATEPSAIVEQPQGHGEGGRLRRRTAWITGAVAVAALAFGAVEAVLWANRAASFNEHVGPSPANPGELVRNCGADAPQRGGPGCDELYEKVRMSRALAISGLAVGGLLGVVSTVLFVTLPDVDSGRLSCAPTFPSAGVRCGFAFTF